MFLRTIIISIVSFLSIQVSAQTTCKNVFVYRTSLEDKNVIRFMSFNVLNLYLHTGKYNWLDDGLVASGKNKLPKEKDRKQTQEIADAIFELKPDFLLLQEVEGLNSIERFTKDYLNNDYQIHMPKTNDQRGIGSALLVKKSVEVEVTYDSNEFHKWHDHANNNRVSPVFSRSFPVFKIFKKGNDKPAIILAGVHFKSRRDRRNDPKSFYKRTAEIEKATDILREMISENEHVPIIVMGDFNSARGQKEVEAIRNGLKLFDAHSSEVHFYDPSQLGQATHTYHPGNENAVRGALDMALLSDHLFESLVRSAIYRYKDAWGRVKKIPESREERDQNPSDHYPIYFDLNKKLLAQ